MLRSHAFGFKNDRDVSFQSFQKKCASDGAPAQRPPHMAVSLAGLHRCTDKSAFSACCSQRRDTAVQHFGSVDARTVLVSQGLEQVNRGCVTGRRYERQGCGFCMCRGRAC